MSEPNTVPKALSRREMLRFFRPYSRERAMLERGLAILDGCATVVPAYVSWHLARMSSALSFLRKCGGRGSEWLDISSDPWFALLATSELPDWKLTGTSLCGEECVIETQDGRSFHYLLKELRIEPELPPSALGEGLFDLVSAFEIIEHLDFHPAPLMALANCALKPGGRLVLGTPNAGSWEKINRVLDGSSPSDTYRFGGAMCHKKEYAVWEIQCLLESAGFRVDRVCTYDCFPPGHRNPLLARLFRAQTVAWHAVTGQAIRFRNLLLRSGQQMLVCATKTRQCNSECIVRI